MNSIVKSASTLIILLGQFFIFGTTNAASKEDFFAPYLGFGISNQNIKFEENYGKNIYPDSNLGLNLYAGLSEIYGNFGLEFGLDIQAKNDQTTTVNAGDTLPGNILIGNGEFSVMKTTIKSYHPYLGITGKHKFTILDDNDLEVFGMLGLSASHVKAQQEEIDDELPGLPSQNDIDDSRRTFEATKVIPVAKVGIAAPLSENISINVFANWKGLSSFKMKSNEVPNANSEVRLKNSFGFGAGMQYNFF